MIQKVEASPLFEVGGFLKEAGHLISEADCMENLSLTSDEIDTCIEQWFITESGSTSGNPSLTSLRKPDILKIRSVTGFCLGRLFAAGRFLEVRRFEVLDPTKAKVCFSQKKHHKRLSSLRVSLSLSVKRILMRLHQWGFGWLSG